MVVGMTKRSWIIALVVLVVPVLVLFAVFAYLRGSAGPGYFSGMKGGVVSQILDNPAAYVDHEVIVTADIAEVVADRVFTVSDGEGRTLTVVTASPLSSRQQGNRGEYVAVGAQVRVAGVVEEFSAERLASRYVLRVDETVAQRFDAKPVVVARSLTFSDESNAIWEFEYPAEDSIQ